MPAGNPAQCDWRAALEREVPVSEQAAYRETIVKFHYWLKQEGKRPTLDTFKEHVEWKRSYMPPRRFAVPRKALLWYFKGRRGQVCPFPPLDQIALRGMPGGLGQAALPTLRARDSSGWVSHCLNQEKPVVRSRPNYDMFGGLGQTALPTIRAEGALLENVAIP